MAAPGYQLCAAVLHLVAGDGSAPTVDLLTTIRRSDMDDGWYWN